MKCFFYDIDIQSNLALIEIRQNVKSNVAVKAFSFHFFKHLQLN